MQGPNQDTKLPRPKGVKSSIDDSHPRLRQKTASNLQGECGENHGRAKAFLLGRHIFAKSYEIYAYTYIYDHI